MAWDLSLPNLLGAAAGLAILGVGAFVLLARPHAWVNRLFFLLALTDGASTLLYRLSRMTDEAALGGLFYGSYWYYFAVFVALLAAFGAMFPDPRWDRAWTWIACGAATLLAVGVVAVQALDREALWRIEARDGALYYPLLPLGNMVQSAFVVAIGVVAARMTYNLRRTHSESRRRQSAYVLGGMTVAYAPYAWTYAVQALVTDPRATYFASAWDIALAYWAFLGLVAVMVASAASLARERRPEVADERRFVFACYAAVVSIAMVAAAFPSAFVITLLRMGALLAYPVLLGFAIIRYEVFDIDARVRRAATATLVAAGLAVTFILGENTLEGILQDRLSIGIPSQWAAGALAAVVTALVSIPVVRASRRVATRIVPELTLDELHARKLEVYRHALEGALLDGLMNERESRTLAALRESLGITPAEHERILHEIHLVQRGSRSVVPDVPADGAA